MNDESLHRRPDLEAGHELDPDPEIAAAIRVREFMLDKAAEHQGKEEFELYRDAHSIISERVEELRRAREQRESNGSQPPGATE